MKYAWIDTQRKVYPLPVMCETLAVGISGYRASKGGGSASRKRLTEAQLLALIRASHAQLKGAYGSPRILKEIRARGLPVGKERVERLMRKNGIRGRHEHSVPVQRRILGQFIGHADCPGIAFPEAQQRPGHGAVDGFCDGFSSIDTDCLNSNRQIDEAAGNLLACDVRGPCPGGVKREQFVQSRHQPQRAGGAQEAPAGERVVNHCYLLSC